VKEKGVLFWLAGWIWSIFDKQIIRKYGDSIYSKPTRSPPQKIFSRGIYRFPQQIWHWIQWKLYMEI